VGERETRNGRNGEGGESGNWKQCEDEKVFAMQLYSAYLE
jgi:hypothetical protein